MGDWNVMQVSQLSPFGRFAISEGSLSFCLLRNDNLHEKQPYLLFSSLSSIFYAARIFIFIIEYIFLTFTVGPPPWRL
jgi:hypothetical protein